MNMKTMVPILAMVLLTMVSCRSRQQTTPAAQAVKSAPAENLTALPWPNGNAPDGFMAGLQLVSLPVTQTSAIVEKVKASEKPHLKPDIKTPLAAAQYFNTHLSMIGPPKYIAVHTDSDGKKYYLFSGGPQWKRHPVFSQAAVLLETGEIRSYETGGQQRN
jgi:hypothetical protein